MEEILNVDRVWNVAIVGAGDIGSALANYSGFSHRGFRIKLIFDNDSQIIGTVQKGFEVKSIEFLKEELEKEAIQVSMIAVPAKQAQAVADQLVKAGVKAILNYAPTNLNVPPDVRVQHIDPSIHLQRMTYYLD